MLFKRLVNLWKLSEWEPNEERPAPLPEGTKVTQIIQKPKAVFIPRVKVDIIKEITQENAH